MKTRSYLLLVFVLFTIVFIAIAFHRNEKPQSSKAYKIVGYVAGWQEWAGKNIEVEKLTHINYAFATLTKSGELNKAKRSDSINLIYLNSLKNKNQDLKILISIGGWGADYFSNAALTEESRKRFSRSAVQFMKKFNLDGVDVDWEYPGQIGGGNIFRKEDKENFTLMLKSLREELDKQSKVDHRKEPYLLTIATGADSAYIEHTNLGEVHLYLDFINIMTYDIYNGLDKETGHHSNLYQSSSGRKLRNSTADAVKGHMNAGVPAEKIVLGLPFYGRGWEKAGAKDNGLYQLASGKHFSLSYDSLKAAYINKNGYVRYWDENAKCPYLWNPLKQTFISYADEESFVYKSRYVKDLGLGGVMFWEYSHDLRERGLLNVLYTELKK